MADGFDYNTRGVISNRLVVMMSNRKVCAGTQSHRVVGWKTFCRWIGYLWIIEFLTHPKYPSITIVIFMRQGGGVEGPLDILTLLSGAQEGGLIEVAISVNELD